MPIDMLTPVFPGDLPQEITQAATINKDGWNEKRISFNSHFSTHIDAPSHMLDNGKSLSDYPIERFVGDAVVIDVRGKKEIQESLNGINEEIVFFLTGHTKKMYTKDFFKDNPVLIKETAKKIIGKKVRIIGIDSFSPDNAPYDTHKMLFKHDILIVENLVHLDKLVGKKFKCCILPLKIKDGDGAPCRVIAVL